jgi:hypothetical protein
MEAGPATSFGHLPQALFLHVLSFLPLVERVRFAVVARCWAQLLSDPTLWGQELRFDGAAAGSVDNAALLRCCKHAGARLKLLDISDPACDSITPDGIVAALAASGAVALETLRTWGAECPRRLRVSSAVDAATLLAASPSLLAAAVDVEGTAAGVAAALRALPGSGPKRVTFFGQYESEWAPELAEWLPAAIYAANVTHVQLPDADWRLLDAPAAESFVAALTGLQSLTFDPLILRAFGYLGPPDYTFGATLLGHLCRALTAESLLTELALPSNGVTGNGAASIAALLAPGRSCLRTLSLYCNNLTDGGGCGWLPPSAPVRERSF